MRFSVDRIEKGIAVCYDEENRRYEFARELLSLPVGALFEAEPDETGAPRNVRYLKEETEELRRKQRARLSALFARNPEN